MTEAEGVLAVMETRSKSEPRMKLSAKGIKRNLDVQSAFKHSAHMPPQFSMRKKTAFGDIKFSGTEPSGPLAEKYDAIMNAPPKWSMLSRVTGIPKAPDQP